MKKIILSAVTVVFVGATLVFANTTSKNENTTCPDGTICVRTPDGKCIILKHGSNTNYANSTCDMNGCVCTE